MSCAQPGSTGFEMAATYDVTSSVYPEPDSNSNALARPPTRTTTVALEPIDQYHEDFPNRHELVLTPGTNLLCGLYAAQRSIWHQTSLRVPSIEELILVVHDVLTQIVAVTGKAMSPDEFARNFSYDNLTQILAEYGRNNALHLQLGVHFPHWVFPSGIRHRVMNAFPDDAEVAMVWVHLDPTPPGHYWGMRHPISRHQRTLISIMCIFNKGRPRDDAEAEDEYSPKVPQLDSQQATDGE